MQKLKIRWWVGGSAGIVLLIATLVILGTVGFGKPEANPVADQFKAPSMWEITNNTIVKPSLVCLGGNPCPFVHRTWKSETPVTAQSLKTLLAATQWDAKVEGTCELPEGAERFDEMTVCDVTGSEKHFKVKMNITAETKPPHVTTIQLYVIPN